MFGPENDPSPNKLKALKALNNSYSFNGDSLANVGGFVGGAGGGGSGAVDVLKQSLRVHMMAKEYLRQLSENKTTF
jgi:hypothetical protein